LRSKLEKAKSQEGEPQENREFGVIKLGAVDKKHIQQLMTGPKNSRFILSRGPEKKKKHESSMGRNNSHEIFYRGQRRFKVTMKC